MTVSFSLQKLENSSKYLSSSSIQDFCQLQSEQLVYQQSILFARIVYHDSSVKSHQEVLNYAPNQIPFSAQFLAYLRSEKWLTIFPHVGDLNEYKLDDSQFVAYICPIGYKNQKPEYIQIITHESLSPNLQQYIQRSAILISKYADIYLENDRQKSELQLLEEVFHRIGHQLRNSLGLIGLYAQNLYLGLKDNPLQEQATIISESIQDLDSNLNGILDCSQNAKLRTSCQDLRSLVLESIKALEPLINRKHLQVCIPDTSTTLKIDRLQMKQVFDNILSNAVHFSPDSGTITCNWQIFQSEVLIKISDQGTGLSQEDIQKIFTPFYSRRLGGTGLGLTIAKKIILDHQGSLWAQNLSKSGAQFSLILPRPKNV